MKSGVHRVVLNATASRYSIGYFCNPNLDIILAPFPKSLKSQPCKFKSMALSKYRAEVFASFDTTEYVGVKSLMIWNLLVHIQIWKLLYDDLLQPQLIKWIICKVIKICWLIKYDGGSKLYLQGARLHSLCGNANWDPNFDHHVLWPLQPFLTINHKP